MIDNISYEELMGKTKTYLEVDMTDTTMATETTTETTNLPQTASVTKTYPKGLNELNVLTKDGQAIIAAQGHSKNRFKRNYDTGTATYTCKDCGATLTALVQDNSLSGTVMDKACTKPAENNPA